MEPNEAAILWNRYVSTGRWARCLHSPTLSVDPFLTIQYELQNLEIDPPNSPPQQYLYSDTGYEVPNTQWLLLFVQYAPTRNISKAAVLICVQPVPFNRLKQIATDVGYP